MKNLKLFFSFWKLNLLSELEYKTSFFIQVVMMVLNDIMYFLVWIFLFAKFQTVWWLDKWQFATLLSINVMVFAIIHIFFAWYEKIWNIIENWNLDSHLLLPKNLLFRLYCSKTSASAIWDLIYAFMIMIFIPNLSLVLVLKIIFFSIIWSMAFLWFMTIFWALSFYIWSSRNLYRAMLESLLWPSHYPPKIFENVIFKIIFICIIPVYFTSFGLLEIILEFDFYKFIFILLWNIVFLSIWIFSFYNWLKRYESWNLVTTNV